MFYMQRQGSMTQGGRGCLGVLHAEVGSIKWGR